MVKCQNDSSPVSTAECLRKKPWKDVMYSFPSNRRLSLFHTGRSNNLVETGVYYAPYVDGNFIRENLIDVLANGKINKNIEVMAGFNYDEATLFTGLDFMLYKDIDNDFLQSALEISYTKEYVSDIMKLYKDKALTNLQLMEDILTDSSFARITRVTKFKFLCN